MAKRFEELTFRDNFMFEQVMSDAELCREVLEVLLGEPIGKLIPAESEKTIGYIADGKQIRLDILTEDLTAGTMYDTEMQKLNNRRIEELALGKRSRYYHVS
ncbi:MAG: transposase, partial [Lachnospiraceae bacterium]|nr:transposase [Lachnospiraceae bacterium]